MKKKNECMTLEEYIEQFDEYYKRAKLLPKSSKSMEILQRKLSDIGLEAGYYYSINKNAYQQDYQLKVDIFLKFDEFLKLLKREFKLELGKKTSSCKFYVNKNPEPSSIEDKKFQDTLNF